MKCPFCQSEDVKIVDTRKFDTVTIRIRFCSSCRLSFQTEEEIKLPSIVRVISTHIPK